MRTRQAVIVVASVLALALGAGLVLAHSARATFPGRNGLIAFVTGQMFVMNPDGSGQKEITHSTANSVEPSISPDGKTIAFVRDGGEIRAMTTTGAGERHLATGGSAPAFSPDGRQVVFVCRKQVWVMNADGSHQRRLTALGRSFGDAWIPTYSPDGKTIVFVVVAWVNPRSPKSRCEILAMNSDGSHLRRLAYTTAANYRGPATLGVSFSPDSKKIVYDAWATRTQTVVRIMNADGSGQRVLPRSYGFTWPSYSPDGRQILCLNGHLQIAVVNTDGTNWRQLTHLAGGVGWRPDWGPHVR